MSDHLEWVRVEENCIDTVKEAMEEREALLRVVRAAEKLGEKCAPGRSVDESRSWFWDYELLEFFETLEALPEHLRQLTKDR